VIGDLKTFKVPIGFRRVDGQPDKVVPYDHFNYQLNDKQREAVAADLKNLVEKNSGLMADKEGLEWIQNEFIPLSILKHNLQDITAKIFAYGKGKQNAEFASEYHHPDLGGGSNRQENGEGDIGDKVYSFLAEQMSK